MTQKYIPILNWASYLHYVAFLLILFINSQNITSQHNIKSQETITINIKSKTNDQPVPFSYILNSRTRVAKETDAEGICKMQVELNDSILFRCLGYQDTVWVVTPYHLMNDSVTFYSDSKSYNISEVKVHVFRSYAAFKYRVAKMPIKEKPNFTPNMSLYLADIPSLNRANNGPPGAGITTSPGWDRQLRKEQKFRSFVNMEKQYERYRTLTSRENLKALTKLDGEKLDKFIVFLRAKHKISPTASDYDMLAAIELAFQNFLAMNTDTIPQLKTDSIN